MFLPSLAHLGNPGLHLGTPHTTKQRDCQLRGQDKVLGTARCRDPISPVTAGARGSNLHTDLSKASRAVSHTPPHHTSRQLSAHYKDYEPWILNNKQLLAAKLSASQCKLITFSQGHYFLLLHSTAPRIPRAAVRTWPCGFLAMCFILHFILKNISSYKSLTAFYNYNSQSDTCLLYTAIHSYR